MCSKPGKGRHGISLHAKATYQISPFQVYCTSTSCLPCDLEFFMFAVMKTFVTDISASTGRNDFIFDIWLLHGDLYRISPFQAYRTSTSCLPCHLRIFHVFTAFSGNECWQVTMPKPCIKYKIISSSRSWDICYENFHYGKHEKF
jgi:hypothetical protein